MLRCLFFALLLSGCCFAARPAFLQHILPATRIGHVNGYALHGHTLFTWGKELSWRRLPHGATHVVRDAGRSFSEGGCLTDVDGDGRADILVNEQAAWNSPPVLVWFHNPDWTRHVIDTNVDSADVIPATLLRHRGILLIHRRMQVRFYEIPANPEQHWHAKDMYSVYSPSRQGGLLLADIDGDGLTDVFCGNYWIHSPKRFDLPWRLFNIEPWNERDNSALMRLAYGDLLGDGSRVLLVVQRAMSDARLAWFDKPGDPRKRWKEHRIADSLDLNEPNSLDLADFDGDGRPDILVAEKGGAGRLIILRNEARGKFVPEVISRGRGVEHAFALDLNGDNRPDILVIAEGVISWWENTGRRAPSK